MGIHGFTKFISHQAPKAITYAAPESFIGRVVAVDASLSLYQFMVAIRAGEQFGNLTNAQGETTSHIAGMLSRAIRILELGMKPIYIFDGKPPTLKGGELAKRKARKEVAEATLEEAAEVGDAEAIKKFAGRTVKITKQHNEDVKKLLRLMGIPVVEAPGEAEAQCASLCKLGKAYATATEDADALCFGTPLLMRKLTFTNDPKTKKKEDVMLVDLKVLLSELNFTMDQFIDFCILCGCDYCDSIKGIGPSTAYNLISQKGSLENIIENLDPAKHPLPEVFPYQEARGFFVKPDLLADEDIPDIQWNEPDEEGLKHFLVEEQSFSAVRVDNAIARLKKAKQKTAQTRLDSFFSAVPKPGIKRPLEPSKSGESGSTAARKKAKKR